MNEKGGKKWYEEEVSPYSRLKEFQKDLADSSKIIEENIHNEVLLIWNAVQKEFKRNISIRDKLNLQFPYVLSYILLDSESFLEDLATLSQLCESGIGEESEPSFYTSLLYNLFENYQKEEIPTDFPALDSPSVRRKLVELWYRKQFAVLYFCRGVSFFYKGKYFDCIADLSAAKHDKRNICTELDYFANVYIESSYIACGYFGRGGDLSQENYRHALMERYRSEGDPALESLAQGNEFRIQMAREGVERRSEREQEFENVKLNQFTVEFPDEYTYEVYINNINGLFNKYENVPESIPVALDKQYFNDLLEEVNADEEVEIRDDAIRGRCVVARRDFERGERIFQTPVTFISTTFDDGRCSQCGILVRSQEVNDAECEMCGDVFCSQTCLDEAGDLYHSEMCQIVDDDNSRRLVAEAVVTSEVSDPILMSKLYGHVLREWGRVGVVANPFESVDFFKYNYFYKDFQSIYLLEELDEMLEFQKHSKLHRTPLAGWSTFIEFRNVINTNGYMFTTSNKNITSSSASEASEKGAIMEASMEPGEPGQNKDKKVLGSAVGGIISYLNHSCAPNATLQFDADTMGKTVNLIAWEDIQAGSEINVMYVNPAREDYERELKRMYGIECPCISCEKRLNAEEQLEEMKRGGAAGAVGGTNEYVKSSMLFVPNGGIMNGILKMIKKLVVR